MTTSYAGLCVPGCSCGLTEGDFLKEATGRRDVMTTECRVGVADSVNNATHAWNNCRSGRSSLRNACDGAELSAIS